MTDVIVIGAGHNGLVTAAMLARAGVKVLVLERSDRVGGCARTTEVAPGFRCSTLAHAASLDSAVIRTLGLEQHGLQIVRPQVDALSPGNNGRPLVLWRDAARAAHEVTGFSPKDGGRYPAFVESVGRISRVLRAVLAAPPPSIDEPSAGDLVEALKAGRAFRSLGKPDAYRLLRWLPMAAADFAAEWFESEPLRATVAASGTLGSFMGLWSAGSTALLLLLAAGEGHPFGAGWFARGGIGAIADALAAAARDAGAEIRTGADVAGITMANDSASGVVLDGGEQLPSKAVVSNVDPKRTLLQLVDPARLDPEFRRRVQNIRAHGTLAKINYAVHSLPQFSCLSTFDHNQCSVLMAGRIRLGTSIDAIERAFDAAKYGRVADEPWIELTIPTLSDETLAPRGQHVVSAYLQYAPYQLRGTTWDAERDRLGKIATDTIERYAPGFSATVLAQQVITPLDLERTYGLSGGHIFHGELALDQLFIARPVLGWARYATPIPGLYLCGSGTHPGTGLNGRSGAVAARVIRAALR